jgi:hypothetical protein
MQMMDWYADFRTGASWKTWLVFGLLLLALWLPRGLALDRFVTPDEPAWIGRAAAFYVALTKRDLAGTFQHGHPGVTLTWAGAIAFRWIYPALGAEATPKVLKNWQNVEPFLREHGIQPIGVLQLARSFMVLGNVLALGLAFLIARRLVGLWPALAGFLLIAFDPFDAGLTRLLHLDGLLSSLMLLSILAFAGYLWGGIRAPLTRLGRIFDLCLSAGAAGLGWLTKSPAVFLVGFTGLLVLVDAFLHLFRSDPSDTMQPAGQADLFSIGGSSRRPGEWKAGLGRMVRSWSLWFGLSLAVFVILWPVMWVHPLDTVQRVFAQALSYAAEGHDSDIFFNGRIISGDPGWLFYPITWSWRTTPVVMFGLVFGIVAFARRRAPFDQPIVRRTATTLLLFSLLYALAISFSAKKFDRYLLPIYGPLDMIAGMGWLAVAGWLLGGLRRWFRLAQPVWFAASLILFMAPVAGQMAYALPTFPYYLSYYNPLLGGSSRAPQVMMIGWGEGLDQVARYLNTLPDPEALRVMTHYPDGCISYFFKGQALGMLDDWEGPDAEALQGVDYLVLYIHQWQRQQPDPRMLAYFAGQMPAYVVRINGLDYAQVYHLPGK